MDELSAFRFADPLLVEREARLLERADLVFTGGYSLYEAKRGRHPDVHPFPLGGRCLAFRPGARRVWRKRRISARSPALGSAFYGVIDERIDLDLIDAVAGGAARNGRW